MIVQRCLELVVNKDLVILYFFFHLSIRWPVTNTFLSIDTRPVHLVTKIRVYLVVVNCVRVVVTILFIVHVSTHCSHHTIVIILNIMMDNVDLCGVSLVILNINVCLILSLFLRPVSLRDRVIVINRVVNLRIWNVLVQVLLSWMIPLWSLNDWLSIVINVILIVVKWRYIYLSLPNTVTRVLRRCVNIIRGYKVCTSILILIFFLRIVLP